VLGVVLVNSDALHEQIRFLQNACRCHSGATRVLLGASRSQDAAAAHDAPRRQRAAARRSFSKLIQRVERVSLSWLGVASAARDRGASAARLWRHACVLVARRSGEALGEFLNALRGPCTMAESMGGLETLVKHPAIMTHAHLSREERAKLELADTLVRVSVGLEDVDDIIEDISRGLDAMQLSH
jgi:cystathionine gamma-lyase